MAGSGWGGVRVEGKLEGWRTCAASRTGRNLLNMGVGGFRIRAWFGFAGIVAVALLFPVGASALGPGGWDHLGDGGTPGSGSLNDRVLALEPVAPSTLYVGGTFTDAGGNANADYIASWNGTSWSNLGPGSSLNGAVNAIAVGGGKVIAGGNFTNAGGDPNADYIAAFNGSTWEPICTTGAPPTFTAGVLSLEVVGSTLWVGGSFLNVDGNPAGDQLVSCDLNTGALIGPPVDSDADLDGPIIAIAADGTGGIYVGGNFINLDGIPQADYVARYTGSWSALGSGSGPGQGAIDTLGVDSLAVSGGSVYVGTDDEDVAGIPDADHVAKWNGSAWSAVGPSFFGPGAAVNGLLVLGSNVYATGSFLNAGGNPLADNVAVFDGTSWSNLGSDGAGNGPWIGTGYAMAAFGGDPVAGGLFTNAGGDVQADRIARYPLADEPPPPGGDPPEAEIGKAPKRKIVTKKKKVKVKFTFAAEDATGFLCKLDKKPAVACTSPATYKVKAGKHKFSVQALDAEGQPGPADSVRFKVKRKR